MQLLKKNAKRQRQCSIIMQLLQKKPERQYSIIMQLLKKNAERQCSIIMQLHMFKYV